MFIMDSLFAKEINRFHFEMEFGFLYFKMEFDLLYFQMEYDPLFKFYILASFVVVNAMGIILLLTEKQLRRRI